MPEHPLIWLGFTIHVPIAGMSLLPVHILFLELIIDPACSTIFEAEKEEPNLMRRPCREAKGRWLWHAHPRTAQHFTSRAGLEFCPAGWGSQ